MPWTERQHGLLQAIGLRGWSPPLAGAPLPAKVPENTARRPSPAVQEPVAAPYAQELTPRAPAGDERARHIATLDWPALRSAVAGCRACTLCEGRQQTVFGVGHTRAQWMVVGEAPGRQEDEQGEPFVGAAGQLLDAMLRALALSRADSADSADSAVHSDQAGGLGPAQQVYIANTLKCRPPGNRNPEPAEMAQCEPFLMRQIALVQPRIILAMGRFAVQALLRSTEPIGKLRGRVHRYQGVPLVVTYHPAYLLRNLPDKARAWEDLCLAAQVFDQASAAQAEGGEGGGGGVAARA